MHKPVVSIHIEKFKYISASVRIGRQYKKYSKDQLANAVKAYNDGQLNLPSAGKQFGIPMNTIYYHARKLKKSAKK